MSQILKFENEEGRKSYFEQDMPRAIKYLLKQKEIQVDDSVVNKITPIVMNTLITEAHAQGGSIALTYDMKTVDLNHLSNPAVDLQDMIEGAIKDNLKEKMSLEQLQAIGDSLMTYINRQAKQTSIIDVDQEIDHMINHVQATWDTKDIDIESLLKSAWTKALDLTKNEVDKYGFHVFHDHWTGQRENYKNWTQCTRFANEEQFKNVINYDAINKFADDVYFKMGNLHDIIRKGWDFSTVCDNLTKEMKKDFPGATSVRPKGWKKLEKNYSDFDGQEEYCESQSSPDFIRFQGVNSDSAGAPGFEGRIALPYVMYDDKCQGRKPFYTLVGAVLGHAFFVNSQNNSLKIVSELEKIRDLTSGPEYFKDLAYAFDPIELTDHNLTKALILLTQENKKVETPEEFFAQVHKSIKSMEEYNNLSQAQKDQRAIESKEYSSQLISKILADLKDEEKQEAKKNKPINPQVLELLNISSKDSSAKKPKMK